MSDLPAGSRSARLDRTLRTLLTHSPEVEAAAVVTFDGLPMASALPPGMDEDRVAAMSAALLSLGERAAEGLGRGELSQVYIEGENGTVFLVSAEDEAVLVAVGAKGAKTGLMLFEVRRAAAAVAEVLRREDFYAAETVPAEPVLHVVPTQAQAAPARHAATHPAPSQSEPGTTVITAAAAPVSTPAAATWTPAPSTLSALPSGPPLGTDPMGTVLPIDPPRWT